MRVYNAEPWGYSERARKRWEEKGYVYQEGSWDELDQLASFPDVAVLIVRLKRKVTAAVLEKFPDLNYLISATTGHDHLDVDALITRGIQLVSLRGQTAFLETIPSTAEHMWALLMALMRNISPADQHVQSGKWQRDHFRGYQLKDKTLGIIGYGRTGRKVAQYAQAFGMQVCAYDPYVSEWDTGIETVSDLTEMLRRSDVVSLHVHLNEETHHLLNATNLQALKKGTYVINTSRGNVWDEKALIPLLGQGVIAGIATDVLSTELDDITQSPLWKAQQDGGNILITPHIGGATWDAMWTCEEFVTTLC